MQPENKPNQPAPEPANTSTAVAPPDLTPKKSRKFQGTRSILSTLLVLLIAPILALAITAFVFQSYEVDGPSMNPTLATKDRLIIWKAGRTWARITNEDYMPGRGSVIVFVKKGLYDFSSDKEKQLIKRVIGLPGDRVVVRDGSITVYNQASPEGFNPDTTLGYGKDWTQTTDGNVDITVPAGELFVAGDNRANSLDSRSFGTIPEADVIGTLSLRILPLSEATKF